MKDVLGDMTLSNLLIEELDLSQINFNGNTLTLQCARLNKIVGPETFNGSLLLLPKSCRLTEFTLEGISNIQGDFQCKDYSYVKEFVMPFIRVAGDMTIALNSGSVNTAAEIEFPKLQEIGGTLTLGSNSNANNIAFPSLKRFSVHVQLRLLILRMILSLPIWKALERMELMNKLSLRLRLLIFYVPN